MILAVCMSLNSYVNTVHSVGGYRVGVHDVGLYSMMRVCAVWTCTAWAGTVWKWPHGMPGMGVQKNKTFFSDNN
jgi:hypothetical protein